MFVDPEFQFLEDKIVSTSINTVGARNHVTEIEGQINVIKERMWAHHSNLLFPSLTRWMAIDRTKHVVIILNTFPPKIGISTIYSPQTIMTGKTLDWNKMCKLPFGVYAQVYEDRNISNTMRERTQGETCLGPTSNVQGTYNFILLRAGKKITCGKFAEVSSPTILMKRVSAMALAENQSEGLIFENRTVIAVDNILPDDDVNKAFREIDRNIAGVELETEHLESKPIETEPAEAIIHNNQYMPLPENNQYALLAKNDEDN